MYPERQVGKHSVATGAVAGAGGKAGVALAGAAAALAGAGAALAGAGAALVGVEPGAPLWAPATADQHSAPQTIPNDRPNQLHMPP